MTYLAVYSGIALRVIVFIALFGMILLIAKFIRDLFTPYGLNDELIENANPTIAFTMGGYYLAIGAIYIGIMIGPDNALLTDMAQVTLYSLLGIFLLNISWMVNDKVILHQFSISDELITHRNMSVAAAQAGAFIATGLIAAAALNGEGGMFSLFVFFVLGQTNLYLFSVLYEKLSHWDFHELIKDKNVGAGIAFGCHLIALAIIIMNASAGDFIDWKTDLADYAFSVLLAFIVLPVVRLAMDRLVVSGRSLSAAIAEDGNIGCGILEGVMAICFAAVLATLI